MWGGGGGGRGSGRGFIGRDIVAVAFAVFSCVRRFVIWFGTVDTAHKTFAGNSKKGCAQETEKTKRRKRGGRKNTKYKCSPVY